MSQSTPNKTSETHRRRAAEFDEIGLAPAEARTVYDLLYGSFTVGTQFARRVQEQSQRLMQEMGVTWNLFSDKAIHDRVLAFDPFPRVIAAEEMAFLRKVARQRLAVWNAFFRDIYDAQEILRAGVIPFQIVFDDPGYQRAAVGVRVPRNVHVHVAAFDFARNLQGGMVVIEDNVSFPLGMSYAIQSRNVLAQAGPDFLELAPVSPISDFGTELLEHLRGFAGGPMSEPRVVILAAGDEDEAQYENSFMARQMGIPLVRGGDLIVLNNRVYLKTIGGLEPIDVIWCRMDDGAVDPVALDPSSTVGVPGLMTCVRKGTVTLANAVGTGLGGNRALMAHVGKMCKFYLGEPLLMPSVRRLLCGDPDQCEQVLSNLSSHVIFRAVRGRGRGKWDATVMNGEELEDLARMIREEPRLYVAEPPCAVSTLPTVVGGQIEKRHAGLRVFELAGREDVAPCVLTRHAIEKGSEILSARQGGGIKDTWVLRAPDAPEPKAAPAHFTPRHQRIRLGSRIAENLYWLGRHIERAENTTRMLGVIQQVQPDAAGDRGSQEWAPLWEALASATGHPTNFFKKQQFIRRHRLSHYLLLDRGNLSSVAVCVANARTNARATREAVPPEVWSVVNGLHGLIQEAEYSGRFGRDFELYEIQELQHSVLNQMDAFTGAVSKAMLHNDAYHFLQIGVYLERAITTLLATRQVFMRRAGDPEGRRLDANLHLLLRMLSCLYAYRSLYQSRPAPQPTVTMLLQDPEVPRSVLFCLRRVEACLRAGFTEDPRGPAVSPLRQCARLVGDVSFAELDAYFSGVAAGKTPSIARLLEELADRISGLAVAISDHYLDHQAFTPVR